MQFKDMIKNKELLKALEELNLKDLTKIQEEVYNNYNKKNDLLITSRTGSGKTLAYLLPALDKYLENKTNELFLTIIVPTNELIYQLNDVIKKVTKYIPLNIMIFDKNLDHNKAIEKLRKPVEIVIGTPKKLHIYAKEYNLLKLYKTENIIIDEADMVLKNEEVELDEILEITKESKKIFCSATFQLEVVKIAKKRLNNFLILNGDNTTPNIKHYFIDTKDVKREETLKNLLECFMPYICIIFVREQKEISEVKKVLENKNFIAISSELTIRERKQILKDIREAKYQYILTTDIISRGIDINDVSHIINYTLPYDYEFYIHRQGRTARMEKDGIIYTLYDNLDDNYLNNLEKRNVIPEYVKIIDKELVKAKSRNERENRKRETTDYLKQAYKRIKKTKVTPGHKKKRQEEALKLAKKLKTKDKNHKKW